jgi:hypothetical protein
MSSNYHTPYPDAMPYKTSLLNIPPGELDAQITINVTAIDALEEDINQTGLSAGAGKFAMVNEGGTALIFRDIVCSGGAVVISNGEVVVN